MDDADVNVGVDIVVQIDPKIEAAVSPAPNRTVESQAARRERSCRQFLKLICTRSVQEPASAKLLGLASPANDRPILAHATHMVVAGRERHEIPLGRVVLPVLRISGTQCSSASSQPAGEVPSCDELDEAVQGLDVSLTVRLIPPAH